MGLSAEERVVLIRRLAAAEEAYHALVTGNKASVLVDHNLERIEYVKADLNKLSAYINDLRRRLGMGGSASAGPMRVFF